MQSAAGNPEPVTPQDIIDAPAAKDKASAKPGPAKVARAYFEAVAARDVEAMASCWKAGGIERISGIGEFSVPAGLRQFFGELFAAMPDLRMEVVTVVAARSQAAVQWRSTGTFCGASFLGIAPTGTRVQLEGLDLLTIEDGLIVRNDAFQDGTDLARQLGMLPPQDSPADHGMTALFNARTKLAGALRGGGVTERVADRVWVVRGGLRNGMNVYLIDEGDGVTVFEAGVRSMSSQVASEAAKLGGIKRVVLSHAHADHRGTAPSLRAPVFCHPDEVGDARGDGGFHYFDFSKLERRLPRTLYPTLLRRWDGGPVEIEGTVSEGDEIAGFEVVHLPGHAPGLIGLWRASDRLALVSDAVYFGDAETFKPSEPVLPHSAFNWDSSQAAASLRKVIALDPATVWSGHADAIDENIAERLERAASGWRPS